MCAQLVWNGAASELEGLQWLTEISLGYLGVVQEHTSHNSGSGGVDASALTARVQRNAVAGEVRVLLCIVFELLSDGVAAHGTTTPRKALPQLLGLLPILLSVLADAGDDAATSDRELHEVQLAGDCVAWSVGAWACG